MTTELIGIIGWLLFVGTALRLFSARRANRGWRRLYSDKVRELGDLQHRHLIAKIDRESMDWLSAENRRLVHKCAAVCSQIRRLKGRGTSGVNPVHRF